MMIQEADLDAAYKGSHYFIAGCGGPLEDWVSGYQKLFDEEGIGMPVSWFKTTGREVNAFGERKIGGPLASRDKFPEDLTCLMFPLDGLNVGALAMFRLRMRDRWFDDVIGNLRTR